MASLAIQMADAIVAELNSSDREWSQDFSAERAYLPTGDLAAADFKNLKVSVVAREFDPELATRSGTEIDIAVDIGVQKKTDADKELTDPLVALGEELAKYFRATKLTAGDKVFSCYEAKLSPIFIPDHLEKYGVYSGVVTIRAKVLD